MRPRRPRGKMEEAPSLRDKARIFAIQCNLCHCTVVYEWSNDYTTKADKMAALRMFVSYLWNTSYDCEDEEDQPFARKFCNLVTVLCSDYELLLIH